MKTIWITIIFLLISTQPLLAVEPDNGETKNASIEYQSRKLFYLFLTKDYLSLLEQAGDPTSTPDEKDLIQFLLQLPVFSESKKNFSPGKFQMDDSALSKLHAIAYGNRKYEEALTLSRMLENSGDSRYREGMNLLSLRKLEDAGKTLEQVSPEDPLYLYARIALAQKEFMRQNIDGAENDVRRLITHPLAGKNGLSDQIHLLLGRILFEKGRYPEALQEFTGISQNSHLYEDALLGQGWCYVKLGEYGKAIPMFEKIKKDVLDSSGREILITLGHCLIRSDNLIQARQHFENILAVVASRERELSQIVENKTLRGRYTAFLKGDAEPVSEEERYYLSYLGRDSKVRTLLSEIGYLDTLRAGFLEAGKKVTDNETYIDNMKDSLNEMAGSIEAEIARLKEYLRKADIPLDPGAAETTKWKTRDAGSVPVDNYASHIYGSWKHSIERDISNETKFIVRMILRELVRDKQSNCFDDPVICHIASFIVYDKGTFDKSQIRNIIQLLDLMVADLKNIKNGEKISFEELLSGVRGRVNNKMDTVNKTMDSLKKVKTATNLNIKEIEKVLKTAHNILDLHILQSAVTVRYDIGEFKSRLVAGINSIENSNAKDSKLQTAK